MIPRSSGFFSIAIKFIPYSFSTGAKSWTETTYWIPGRAEDGKSYLRHDDDLITRKLQLLDCVSKDNLGETVRVYLEMAEHERYV